MSSASLIGQYKDKGEFDKMDKHIARIKSSVGHLTTILNDFFRSASWKKENWMFRTNGSTWTTSFLKVEEDLRPNPKGRSKNNFRVQVPRNIRNFYGHPHIAERDFNLISNASKYSDAGKKFPIRCLQDEKNFH